MSVIEPAISPLFNAHERRGPALPSREMHEGNYWSVGAWSASLAALATFTGIACAVWLWTGMVVPWDSKNQFYPFFRFLGDSLQSGIFPMWNPYHFGGHPSIADPQSLLFSPTMVLLALIAPQASMQMFDVWILCQLAMGGVGVLGLFQRRNWHPLGAVLAAIIYMLGGSAAARLQHTGIILSYAWFPLALWALEAALQRRSYGLATLFGLLAAFMTLGRDQVAFLMGLTLLFSVAWQVLHADRPVQWLRQRILLLMFMGFVSAAVLIVPVLLTLQFLSASNRPDISYGVAATGSLTPINFITMFAPNFFGSLNWDYSFWGPGYETSIEPNWTDRSINYLFIGTVPLVLLVWHGLACGRVFARDARVFTLLVALMAIYAIGRYSPAFELIFDYLPGVSRYRRPADATFVMNFGFAILAGYLLHRYIVHGVPKPWPEWPRVVAAALVGLVCAVMAVLFVLALQFSLEFKHWDASLRELLIAGGVMVFIALALILPRTPGARFATAFLLVLATMAELVWRNAGASFNSEPIAFYSVYQEMKPVEAAGLAALRKDMAARADIDGFPRVEILGLSGPWQNASMMLGLENTLGYNPLRIADYERAVGPGENAEDTSLRQFPGTFRGYRSTLASLLGLEYLVLDRPLTKLPRHVPRPLATQIFAGEKFYVYRLGKVTPRAYLASIIKPVDSEAVLESHEMPEFDHAHEVLVDDASMSLLSQAVIKGNESAALDPHVQIAAHHANSSVIEVDTESAGVLVLHDLYYPGWEVTVDGKPMPLLRVNILFRGVEVPFGHHIVEFSYNPLSWTNLRRAAVNALRGDDE